MCYLEFRGGCGGVYHGKSGIDGGGVMVYFRETLIERQYF